MAMKQKVRYFKQCNGCGGKYHKSYISTMSSEEFAKCPWCFEYETLAGFIRYRIIHTEVMVTSRRWWNPFGWFTARWVVEGESKVDKELQELRRMVSL